MRLHLPMCRDCRRYARQLARLSEAIRIVSADAAPPRLPAAARARIRERLYRDEPGRDM